MTKKSTNTRKSTFVKGETHLQEGDQAPDFQGKDENGKMISLKDFKGKKLVLFFYPKDNTPGCTAEACSLSENYDDLKAAGLQILGVSADSEKRHQNFINKFRLPYHLLADTEMEVIKKYGVWGKKRFMGRIYDGILRTTFVIDGQGKIIRVFKDVKTKTHASQILESLEVTH